MEEDAGVGDDGGERPRGRAVAGHQRLEGVEDGIRDDQSGCCSELQCALPDLERDNAPRPDSVHRLFFYCSNVTSKYIVHDYAHFRACRPQSSAADLRTSSCQTSENSSKVLPWPIARASMGTMLC